MVFSINLTDLQPKKLSVDHVGLQPRLTQSDMTPARTNRPHGAPVAFAGVAIEAIEATRLPTRNPGTQH